MKVSVKTAYGEVYSIAVSPDLELENFKVFCEVETGIPAEGMEVILKGTSLIGDKKSLKRLGVKAGDVLLVQNNKSSKSYLNIPFDVKETAGPSRIHKDNLSDEDPILIRNLFLANPNQLALLKKNNPRLADALLSGDVEDFATVLRRQIQARRERESQRDKILHSSPYDVETQRFIAEEIRQKNIEANMAAAIEHSPETFGSVVMLYINCKVNGYPVKAFIDSGAQTTIMSSSCAEKCNIMRLLDTRWAGVAKGVGVQRIIGRIHMVQIQIGNDHLITSFSVLEEQPMDMLLGLDMLRRYQCCIDLKRDVLTLGTTGTEAKFLPENQLPSCHRLLTS